jgi:cytochrome c551
MRKKQADNSIPNDKFEFSLLLFALCLMFLNSCGNDSQKRSNSTKFDQYYVHGEQLYLKHCSNCHQKDGTGLGRLYPPLAKSDFMEKNFDQVLCMMRHGKSGEVIVNGISYNQPMPGISSLTDLQIAEIATYICNSWGNDKGIIEVKQASAILAECDPTR